MSKTFSILHTSARPDQWREVYENWMVNALDPACIEYVLVIDPRWGFSTDPDDYHTALDNLVVVQNTGRRCYVDGVNLAAEASSGDMLIVNADDQYSFFHWDKSLFGLAGRVPNVSLPGEFVIEVDTGTPGEHERGILPMPVLSRSRYKRLGYVFYPQYESMFADNDFCEHARLDGVVIDGRHVGHFPHIHWINSARGKDEADEAQNRPEAWAIGSRVLDRRRLNRFQETGQRTIALCLSGERFEGPWVDGLLNLYGHLINRDFTIMRAREFAYTTNVYITRSGLRRAVLESELRPELCLWLDDDNILSPEHFDKLLALLDGRPEISGAAGWCWIHSREKKGFMPSCGEWAPDHLQWNPFPPSFANESRPRAFEVGGLPCLLMRTETLEQAGDSCFLPVIDNRLEHGMSGEDIAFFLAAEKASCRFLVDPTVRLPHLKYVEVEPIFPDEGKAPVKVACMIRAKNEGRWIGRTVRSVRELCGADVFVMEDGSTDDTVAVAEASGAIVLHSPFAGLELDERRDKNWLLAEVKRRCSPDWILMPDGDEELEPGGCDKIRRALEKNPPVDCFALRFLNLWDSVETVRLDGVYGTMLRQSLFRADSDLEFRSYYEGKSENHNHVGLHVSNAPGLGGPRISPLNVFLIHYGYMHKADRIRKYRWILDLDPNNKKEDFYRHTVQGDLPEVPADAKLAHAGPLDIRPLPRRLVPQFDVVPGPRDVAPVGV